MSHSHSFRRSSRATSGRRDSRSPERGWRPSSSRNTSQSRRSPSPQAPSRRTAERDASTTRESTPSTFPTSPSVAATADSVKSLSVRERLALWRKSKEQAKPAEHIPLSVETDSRPASQASSMADDSNHFVTAPSSVASDMHTGSDAAFESLPATPGSSTAEAHFVSAVSRPQSGSSIVGRPLGATSVKLKLGRAGINGRRPLLKPSLLSKSVFGSDDAGADAESSSSSALQRSKRPPIDFLAASASVETAMDVDAPESDPLEDYMQGVGALVNGSSKDVDISESGGDGLMHTRTGHTAAGDDSRFDDETADDPEDALALAAKRLKKKDLAVVDHSKMNYESFKKDFYIEPAELRNLTAEEVDMMRVDLGGVKIRGADAPKPATSWSHFGLPAACADVIRHQGFEKPTPVQAQSVPAILSGRDVIGVAKTGSGKTLAFILPMLRHIKAQRPLATSEGPIGLVMTPTRELAVQIHRECRPFLKPLGLRAVCAYGGSAIKDQIGELKRGAEIVVCTPGRLIDLLCANSGRVTNLHRVTYLVLDEADRMFDMGFEPQVTKIVQSVRPSRQTVLFSATFPRQMEALARKILRRPLEIVVGGRALIPPEVTQHVEVVESKDKFVRLLSILGDSFNGNSDTLALIFVDRQEAADGLMRDLLRRGYVCNSLHGGKDQTDRDQAIADFKNRVFSVLIATSVAARGLDVRGLNIVINYDCPNHMEDLVHRVGRTGRAGNKGDAYTFISPDQDRYANEVVKALKLSGLTPPEDVQVLADAFLEKVKQGKARHGGKSGFGGKGLEKLDKERSMVKKIQKITYSAATGETLEDDDDDEEEEDDRGADSDGEAPSSSRRGKAKSKDASAAPDSETVRRLGNRRGNNGANDTLVEAKSPQSEQPVAAVVPGPIVPPLPPGMSAVAQAALLAAKAAAQRLNIASEPRNQATPLSVVDQINQQLGTPVTPTSGDIAAAGARLRAANTPRALAPGTNVSTAVPVPNLSTVPVGSYGCELDINDYPQKARWRATNHEALSQIIEQTGAAITTRGIYVPPGKPTPEGERRLYLSIESDSERSAEQAKSEIKRLLTEATILLMEQDARGTTGRYSVV
ncbi:pre-mRNA processing RNA-helicase [Coemansia sp. RSA 455]|nr:pre-mRNA processing RNA-helicase [Coemansia sp. S142-1]KAJ2252477.1 pre-mRNA processing RNA-helicase [Coemansia sp. RSA 455]KAJ2464785.1 pre-mRNA processing RNA-helicase [Coemansia sp. RSA 2337]